MPARKATKSTAKKTAAKATRVGPLPPYGVAIRNAISRGDAAGMKKAATAGRKHLKDVQAALDTLEKAIGRKK